MGPVTAAPAAAPAPPERPPRIAARSAGAVWHQNLSTLDVDALEALYAELADLLERHPALTFATPILERAGRALLATIYHELLVRGGRAIFAGDNIDAVTADEVNAGLTPACESPVCSADHDRDGRHRKAAHL